MMLTKELESTIQSAIDEARKRRHEFVTLEHILFAMLSDATASSIMKACGADLKKLKKELDAVFADMDALPEGKEAEPEHTAGFWRVLQRAAVHVHSSGRDQIDAGTLLVAFFREPQSHAVYLLEQHGVTRLAVMSYISHGITQESLSRDPMVPESEDDETTQEEPALPPAGGDEKPAPSPKDPLRMFTVNLNERAAAGKIDPLVGRETELKRTIQVLCRRRKNNPVFVGESGVGKTAIVEGLALAIHEKRVPKVLEEASIYALDMGLLLAGTKFRGQFEERMKGVLKAIQKIPHAILFIDEIHTVVGAGATTGGSVDASNLLKPALASGDVRCIGSTTFPEFKSSFERDHALARRFQKIEIQQPSEEETVLILKGLRSRYEEHHGVSYSDEAIRAAVELSAKYINDRFLPDKAIDVMDEAGAAQRMLPEEDRRLKLEAGDMEEVVARIARIPEKNVSASDEKALAELEPLLKDVIFGQDAAIGSIASAIKLARSGLGPEGRPIGSFLFSGPTGVGKTELAKQLAQVLGIEFLRFDMSEYMEKHTISRLIGAPPGYVGFDQGGLLTDAIRRTPHAVLVLDEIEKAHPDVFNILLQVMDHATLTDNNGRKADFRHIILIMTTNAGARDMLARRIGFGDASVKAQMGEKGRDAIEKTFSPEFRNRIDAWVVFDSLLEETILRIVDKFVGDLRKQLKEKNVELELTDEARRWLGEKGFDPVFGARPMSRLIQNELKKPLAEKILFGDLKNGGKVQVTIVDDKIQI
ncbi:MAG: ATP-dependent Clp protease ATP-binding subunit ClpA [Candidatus Hydrogenedentota bacterium]